MKKIKITPTEKERVLLPEDLIVSKTDTKGIITYANVGFIKLSCYTEKELLGKPHNLIRHPDMPRGAFKLLWDTIEGGNECFAYVKNLSKDGGYYWVFAHVTPDFDENKKIVGFMSVRRKPKKEALDVIIPIYKNMMEIEKQYSFSNEGMVKSIDFLVKQLNNLGVSYEEFILSF